MSRKLIVIGSAQGKVFCVNWMGEVVEKTLIHMKWVTALMIIEDWCILSASISGEIFVHTNCEDFDDMRLFP